jgi:methionyl-tRNA formyltransferase
MDAIYEAGGALDVAFTLRDEIAPAKSGRVWIDEFCDSRSIPLVKIRHVNEQAVLNEIAARNLDWLFIIGWSQIAGPAVLAAPRAGVLGIHPTLLPEGRGRAAIPWAILKGLKQTGITLFKLDSGVDTGPIVAQEVVAISPSETATTLYARIADAHRKLIHSVWSALASGAVIVTPQHESLATVWPGRRPEDGEFDASASVYDVERLVRAVTHPYPGAFSRIDGRIVRVWKGAVGASNGFQIRLADGIYTATDYEFE